MWFVLVVLLIGGWAGAITQGDGTPIPPAFHAYGDGTPIPPA